MKHGNTKTPLFHFFLANRNQSVTRNSPLWHAGLPSSRHHLPQQQSAAEDPLLTYGEYFEAAALFFDTRRDRIVDVAASLLNRCVALDDLESFAIFLEKHGAFYHPSRVVVSIQDRLLDFVLNVAVSDIGMSGLDCEVNNLNRLNQSFLYGLLPKVYGSGQVVINGNRTVGMFFGEWFEGYSEFHVSQNSDSRLTPITVWDSKSGACPLSEAQATAVYEKAAEILTAYYNIETCEQIFSWHHAAGDFIVKKDSKGLDVKLVTVRRYDRMLKGGLSDHESMLQALLLFLLNMSIRMRLDRWDGVGDMTWIGDCSLTGVLRGFFNGLRRQEGNGFLPQGFAGSLKRWLCRIPEADIAMLFNGLRERFALESPEFSLINAHLNAHAAAFCGCLRHL